MKIIAYSKNVTEQMDMASIMPYLKDESKHAWELYKNGFFRELYFRTDRPGAVVVIESENIEKASKIVAELPLVKAGFIEFEFIPVGPFVPFENLFEK